MASLVSVAVAAAVACGDSVTGDGIPDNPDASTSVDSGHSSTSSSSSSSSSSSGAVGDDDDAATDSGAVSIDGGLPTVSVLTLDFGEVDCGNTGTAQTFTIDNPSGSPVAYSSQLVKGAASPFTIAPASGTIPAGTSITVTVTPNAVPIPSSTSADGVGDTVKLTVGPTNTSIDLKQTAHGAVLRYSLPNGIDFGNTPIGGSTPITSAFAIANAGNADVPVTLSITPDPNITDGGASAFTFATTTTDAALGLTPASITFAPLAVESYAGAVHIVPGMGPLCDTLPTDMPLKGTGTNGVISVTPASISFGNSGRVDCGTTAASQKVRITNTSNGAVTYTATLGKTNTIYGLSNTAVAGTAASVTGTLAAAASGSFTFIDILIQPKAIPSSGATVTADFYADSLDVQTSGATGATDNQVALHETANGAILTRSVNGIGFGSVGGGASQSQQYSFSNTGNVDITVATANAFTNIFSQPGTITIPAGGFATPTATFKPPVSAVYPIPCGTSNIPGKAVHVTNNGPDVTFDLSFGNTGANPPFKATPAKLFIAAGATQDITITPTNLGSNFANVNNVTDTLTLTPEAGDAAVADTRPSPSISLSLTPQGAIINFANHPPSIAFGTAKNPATVTSVISLANSGNLPATINFTTTSSASNVFSVAPAQTTLAAGASGFASTATFTPPTPLTAATNYTGTWNASVDLTSTTLCAPLPLSLAATPQTGTITLTGTGSIAP